MLQLFRLHLIPHLSLLHSLNCACEGAPKDAFNQAEGYRYLSRLVRAGLENFIECNDARAPRFNAIVNGYRVLVLSTHQLFGKCVAVVRCLDVAAGLSHQNWF